MSKPKFLVAFFSKHGMLGVLSKEGIGHRVAYPLEDIEKARTFAKTIQKISKVDYGIYELKEHSTKKAK